MARLGVALVCILVHLCACSDSFTPHSELDTVVRDESGQTALTRAVLDNDFAAFTRLISTHESLHFRPQFLEIPNSAGQTPLDLIVEYRPSMALDALPMLLRNGVAVPDRIQRVAGPLGKLIKSHRQAQPGYTKKRGLLGRLFRRKTVDDVLQEFREQDFVNEEQREGEEQDDQEIIDSLEQLEEEFVPIPSYTDASTNTSPPPPSVSTSAEGPTGLPKRSMGAGLLDAIRKPHPMAAALAGASGGLRKTSGPRERPPATTTTKFASNPLNDAVLSQAQKLRKSNPDFSRFEKPSPPVDKQPVDFKSVLKSRTESKDSSGLTRARSGSQDSATQPTNRLVTLKATSQPNAPTYSKTEDETEDRKLSVAEMRKVSPIDCMYFD